MLAPVDLAAGSVDVSARPVDMGANVSAQPVDMGALPHGPRRCQRRGESVQTCVLGLVDLAASGTARFRALLQTGHITHVTHNCSVRLSTVHNVKRHHGV